MSEGAQLPRVRNISAGRTFDHRVPTSGGGGGGGQLTAIEIFTVEERSHTAVVSLSPELMSVEGGRNINSQPGQEAARRERQTVGRVNTRLGRKCQPRWRPG